MLKTWDHNPWVACRLSDQSNKFWSHFFSHAGTSPPKCYRNGLAESRHVPSWEESFMHLEARDSRIQKVSNSSCTKDNCFTVPNSFEGITWKFKMSKIIFLYEGMQWGFTIWITSALFVILVPAKKEGLSQCIISVPVMVYKCQCGWNSSFMQMHELSLEPVRFVSFSSICNWLSHYSLAFWQNEVRCCSEYCFPVRHLPCECHGQLQGLGQNCFLRIPTSICYPRAASQVAPSTEPPLQEITYLLRRSRNHIRWPFG